MLKFKVLNEKLEFWNTCLCHYELEGFPAYKDISGEVGGNIDVI